MLHFLHENARFPLKSFHRARIMLVIKTLDCGQSLFFFRFSESNARARERRSRETRETCLSRLALSVTRVAICVSRVLLDGLQKKERLLVVYKDVRCKVCKVQARCFCFRSTAMKDRVRLTTLRTT